ncbi:polysaccharide lyase family 8 super-sandwich domain-containing protein [Spirosoma endbachense]|uniref:T9SS type A sorting domain-containing protein n=1 Tax=Spirosoma endbachense TaxID=2666025 RepID=A0A6P1VWN3_9BACT|nr:polysaccharide lyase family 8 super-sandwich domain-containing protein [Spirosoma endbachense]QHV97044.1 T9SS type A sorting domain-containing protein [Spirosoma endbachense]
MKSLFHFFKLADRAKMLFIVLLAQAYSYGQSTADFDLIMDRIYNDFQSSSGATLDANVASLSNAQRSDYSWSDINYKSTSLNNWQPLTHLVRLGLFARAYANPSSAYYDKAELKQKIEGGMNYWLGLDPEPRCANWFALTISVPRSIGNTLICLRKSPNGISSTLENQMLAWMTKGRPISRFADETGSNLTDVAEHYVMRACLTKNQTTLNQAITPVKNTIRIAMGAMGLQKDNSFRFHGPQLYTYGYGRNYISGFANIASWVVGTSLAFPADKIAIFSNFVRNGFIKPHRGAYADFNLFGRGVSRKNAGDADEGVLEKAKAVDISANAGAYDDAIQRMGQKQPASYNVLSEHIHYWRSDYSLHLRPDYTFGLRSVSTRTAKSENGNGENLKGYYLTEGVSYIAVNGDEYFNIFPVWDWNKIPGTTVPEITSIPVRTAWGKNFGKTPFVGGVSDGVYGASVYAMKDYNTTAKKSWFFFDEEIVCLGSGITSGAAQAINTTLNQCLLKTDVTIADGSGTVSVLGKGGRDYDSNVKWVLQGNVGYFFPKGGKVSVSNQAQTGNWSSINSAIPSEKVTADVFKLWFKHGLKPANADYAYIVTPGKTSASQMQAYNGNNISILANDSTQQAVRHNALGIWQIVFYQAGEFKADGVLVKVDKPCVVILKNVTTNTVVVHMADPAQQAQQIHLGLKTDLFSEMKSADMTLPTGLDAGSSVSTTITPSSPVYASSASARRGQAVILESDLPTENPLFTVGPNPASDFIHVYPTSSETYTFTMIDSNGKQVQQKKSATTEKITFDLGAFPAGSYFITADGTNNRRQVVRFLILK